MEEFSNGTIYAKRFLVLTISLLVTGLLNDLFHLINWWCYFVFLKEWSILSVVKCRQVELLVSKFIIFWCLLSSDILFFIHYWLFVSFLSLCQDCWRFVNFIYHFSNSFFQWFSQLIFCFKFDIFLLLPF